MALFKIFKGESASTLNDSRKKANEGYCYFAINEGKMFIDIGDGDVKENPELRVCLNAAHADEADRLTWHNIGYENKPIFLNGSGEPVECDDILAVGISGGLYDVNKQLRNIGTFKKPIYFEDGLPVQCDDTLSVNISGNAATATQANKADEANIAEVAVGATSLIDLVTLQPLEKVGDENTPVYFLNGIPTPCNTLKLPQQGDVDAPIYIDENGTPQSCVDFLPLTAGADKKISGPLGLTLDKNYGLSLPASGFEGEIFFVEDQRDQSYLPTGGTVGQALIKNSAVDGDASWKDIVALPKGGTKGQIMLKNSSTDGDASWVNGYASLTEAGLVSTGNQYFAGQKIFDQAPRIIVDNNKGSIPTATQGDFIAFVDPNGTSAVNRFGMIYTSIDTAGNVRTGIHAYKNTSAVTDNAVIYVQYNANGTTKAQSSAPFYGAVWNDYAEFRAQKEIIEPGYCVASADNGQVHKTTEKFQACDGIVSDTFGFAIGETNECKTPLAVAGRVLAHHSGSREDYHAGDTVCAGPEGKVMKMTREEIREWPDRIIGIVSEIPKYERWGDGNVPVNGRIWIKVK